MIAPLDLFNCWWSSPSPLALPHQQDVSNAQYTFVLIDWPSVVGASLSPLTLPPTRFKLLYRKQSHSTLAGQRKDVKNWTSGATIGKQQTPPPRSSIVLHRYRDIMTCVFQPRLTTQTADPSTSPDGLPLGSTLTKCRANGPEGILITDKRNFFSKVLVPTNHHPLHLYSPV